MVYLVGAGPGDPGLITVKGLELIRRADVILNDRLIPPSLLFEVKPDCVIVDVGKRTGSHSKNQDEITELLVEYGRRDIDVVRLKGGDPYLFGRGGEEAERLAAEGISFEVVPGVSALMGAASYAGIPLTHRDHASSVGIATGHAAAGKPDDPVDWRALAAGVDTTAVFMGVENLAVIAGLLIEGGKSPDTPAALVQNGTTAAQRVVTATLADIAQTAEREHVKPPALFISGWTVPLHETLGWFKPGPLAGLTVGITRPLDRSRPFYDRLASLGARPLVMPTIRTEDLSDTADIRRALERLDQYDTVVFMSANGVDSFFRALRLSGRDARAFAGKTAAVIGPSTAEALARHGIAADHVAKTFVAEGLLETLRASTDLRGVRFLLARSDIGRDTLARGLREDGAVVEEASFYSTKTAELAPFARESVLGGEVDIVTFTSSSTVTGFFAGIRPDELPGGILFASIGPETSKALAAAGVPPAIEAEVHTTEGLADAILSYNEKKKK